MRQTIDQLLRDSLVRIYNQIEQLSKTENTHANLSATEKVLFAELFLKTEHTKNLETRKNEVYASKDWRDFAKGLAVAESDRNKERRKYELLLKVFDAEYLSFKIDHSAINRQK